MTTATAEKKKQTATLIIIDEFFNGTLSAKRSREYNETMIKPVYLPGLLTSSDKHYSAYVI